MRPPNEVMRPTPEQERAIRLLSDTDLYQQAMDFARRFTSAARTRTAKSQLQGLLEFSRTWNELDSFVKHQKGKSHDYSEFYTALAHEMRNLRARAQTEFVPDGLVKRETSRQTELFAGLLAREFVQHLTAEMMWNSEE